MKLFSVSAHWHIKGHRYDMIQTAVIMAKTEEEAIKKYKANVSYPEGASVSAVEWDDGIYTLNARQIK